METESLELVIENRVKPIIEQAMQRYLGITVNEIGSDISDRLIHNPLLGFEIYSHLSFKKAKNNFKKQFILRLLQRFFGNVSKVAEVMDVDRRSIHRLIKEFGIDPDIFRKEMWKDEYLKKMELNSIIESTLDVYKKVINPERLENFYKNVGKVSEDIIKELPSRDFTWKQAEQEFEKRFLLNALEENLFNISKTARKIGLRYETLSRKMQKFKE